MPFKNSNVALGLAANLPYQQGVSDVDPGNQLVEQGITVPWPGDPSASWMYYECVVECLLDSGIVVHNRLPQINKAADTLSSCDFAAPNLDQIVGSGVNLKCSDQFTDIVQRMGHARYWFCLRGQAIRVGYKVPIPGLKSVAGVPAIPFDEAPQRAYNRPVPGANFGGVPVWHAEWELWYTVVAPPTGAKPIPAVDPSAHLDANVAPPAAVQVPYSQPDDNSVAAAPNTRSAPGAPGASQAQFLAPATGQ